MTKKRIAIFNLIVAIFVAAFAVGYAFAWIADLGRKNRFPFGGSSGSAYFAGGNGSSTDPFIITDQYHLYNLAWLQNTGKFGGEKYYFALDADITVPDNFWLPPIGNEADPFISEFNGRGHTITNLKITTNKNLLINCPVASDASYQFSRAVGMFGKTDNVDEEDKCYIHNFILDNPTVVVANQYTNYATSGNYAAGLAIGHVAGKVHSIGVKADGEGADLIVDVATSSAKYSTYNSILGELADTSTSSTVTGGGHIAGAGGSGDQYGSSFDVDSMLARLQSIDANKNSSTPSWKLPDIDNQNDQPLPAAGERMPFTVTSESTYTGANAKEVVADTNVGYFLGNQSKININTLTFVDPLVNPNSEWTEWTYADSTKPKKSAVPRALYTVTSPIINGSITMRTAQGFKVIDGDEFDALPRGIKNVIPRANSPKDFTTIRLQITYDWTIQNYGNTDQTKWSYHGQISWQGNTYGQGFRGADGKPYDENGVKLSDNTFNNYDGGVVLPNNAIWFKPAEVGKFRFIVYTENDNDGFTLMKITRNNATASNPFYLATTWGNLVESGDITTDIIIRQEGLPKYVLYYFDYPVTQDDLDAGNVEYMLMKYGNKGAYFVYLDIGASGEGEDDSSDIGAVDDDSISVIDFIYDGVSIAQSSGSGYSVGDFIVGSSLYEATKTSIYFDQLSTALQIVYIRLHGRSDNYKMYVTTSVATNPEEVLATREQYALINTALPSS